MDHGTMSGICSPLWSIWGLLSGGKYRDKSGIVNTPVARRARASQALSLWLSTGLSEDQGHAPWASMALGSRYVCVCVCACVAVDVSKDHARHQRALPHTWAGRGESY